MKRILKRVFIWGSIAFLSFMVFFYGYRLVHYFVKEHRPDDKVYSMIGYLKDEDNLINNKLLKDGDCYYFRKDAQNNYLLFSGILYRILYLDKENIYLMSDEPVTNLKYGITGEYDKSNIKVWLENIYINNLNSEYLSSKEVTLLDKDTFQKIRGNESYIIGKPFWMVEDNKGLIVDEDGDIKATNNYEDFLGIRPIITINGYKQYISGTGTKDDPYIIEIEEAETLSNLYVGEYIEYKGTIYRIIGRDTDSVRAIRTEKLDEQHIFSNSSNVFKTSNNTELGYYLNNTFLETLNKDNLVKAKWNIGEYHVDYNETNSNHFNGYVGLLGIGDYFISDYPNSYLLNPSGNYIYTISNENYLVSSNTKQKLDVYPVISLKSNLSISSGNGKMENPFVVGD